MDGAVHMHSVHAVEHLRQQERQDVLKTSWLRMSGRGGVAVWPTCVSKHSNSFHFIALQAYFSKHFGCV